MKSLFFTTDDGYQIHYQIFENILPTTTFFIHGNLASNRWWYPAQEVFAAQAKGKNYQGSLVGLEFLGCGKSSAPKKMEDVNILHFAKDFIGLIKSQFKSNEKFNLVGHSTGGLISALMTSLQPELFNKAVLLDPVGSKGLVIDDTIKAAFEAMKTDKNLTEIVIGSTIYNNNPNTDYFKQVIVEDTYSAVQKLSYWVVQALHNLDTTDILKKSNTPCLVLHGDQDVLLSRDASADLANNCLQNAKFELVPNHGHCMNVENPEAFVKKVSGFLFQ